nr:hypothetical protein [Tanacetum cinerariifolium]
MTIPLTKKLFANMKRVGTGFSGVVTLLFNNMLVLAAKEVGLIQYDVQSISIPTEPSTSNPHKKHKTKKQQTQAPKGRIIADIDEDVEINLEEAQAKPYRMDLEHPKKVLSMQDVDDEEPAEVEEVLEIVTATKLIIEVVTTGEATTTAEATKKIKLTNLHVQKKLTIVQVHKLVMIKVPIQKKLTLMKNISYDLYGLLTQLLSRDQETRLKRTMILRHVRSQLVKNIKAGVPFFMFPRFMQLLIDHQLGDMSH